MHDYFDRSTFLNETYSNILSVIATDGITEKQLVANKSQIGVKEELNQRKRSATVYDNMLRNMSKLSKKLKLMGSDKPGLIQIAPIQLLQ